MRKFLLFAVILCATAFSVQPMELLTSPDTNKPPYEKTGAPDNDRNSRPTRQHKFGDYLIVKSKVTDIRKGSGDHYGIIHRVRKNGLMKFISTEGEWHKVLIISIDRIGYVYSGDVK